MNAVLVFLPIIFVFYSLSLSSQENYRLIMYFFNNLKRYGYTTTIVLKIMIVVNHSPGSIQESGFGFICDMRKPIIILTVSI